MLTKKHYERIALILKENKASVSLINDFCSYFKTDNPNFKEDRFKETCGVVCENCNNEPQKRNYCLKCEVEQ